MADESDEKLNQRQRNAQALIQQLRRTVWNKSTGGSTPNASRKEPIPISKTSRKQPATLASYFKASLNDLLEKLQATAPTFVRCVQPNDSQSPTGFDRECVLRQLKYSGVLETVRIRREGYAYRFFFAEFMAL